MTKRHQSDDFAPVVAERLSYKNVTLYRVSIVAGGDTLMSDSGIGSITSQGKHSSPGGGPLVVVGGSSPTLLPLPPTITDDINPEQRWRLNAIQLEYARDVALLQSRAYDAVLRDIMAPSTVESSAQGRMQSPE